MATRILVEARPGMGKTTVARRLLEMLRDHRVPLAGFTTEEIRAKGRRTGFAIEDVEGRRALLAGTGLRGPPRVGRYGVDLEAFEKIALPATTGHGRARVVVIDELGKMELHSEAFRDAIGNLFDKDVSVIATVHLHRHPFTDALKRRPDVEVVRVTESNRNRLPEDLLDRLLASP
jgi:nucleoside-triphosphatase